MSTNQICYAKRIVWVFPIKALRNNLLSSKNPPWWGQGEKCNSSEVTVFYFAVWQSCVREYHFPIFHSLISLKSWFWNSKLLQENSVHQCWPFLKLPPHTTGWHLTTSICLPLLWVKNVRAESDLAQKGPGKSLTASQTVRNLCGAPKPRTPVWVFCSQIGLLGSHDQTCSHFLWHPPFILWCEQQGNSSLCYHPGTLATGGTVSFSLLLWNWEKKDRI